MSALYSEELLSTLAQANHVAILTGAGISAESGVPTFRDKNGLWQKFKPEELASMDGFLRNPDLVWEWYESRRTTIYSVQPNPGHYALAEMQKLFPHFTLITQNIDRLHQRAGSTDVIELHGNIVDNYCVGCRQPFHFDEESGHQDTTHVPRCTYCGGLIRPTVVWFGEMLPEDAIEKAQEAATHCDVFLSIGTSAEVYPAAGLPLLAQSSGAYVIEINPTPTTISGIVDLCIHRPSGEVLPSLVASVRDRL